MLVVAILWKRTGVLVLLWLCMLRVSFTFIVPLLLRVFIIWIVLCAFVDVFPNMFVVCEFCVESVECQSYFFGLMLMGSVVFVICYVM